MILFASKRKITSCLYEGKVLSSDNSNRIMGRVSGKILRNRHARHGELSVDSIRDIISKELQGINAKAICSGCVT